MWGRHRSGTRHGIDRMVRNVETGRFERSLSGADRRRGAGHGGRDLLRARLGQLRQQADVAAGRAGTRRAPPPASPGFFSQRMAKTALPIASAAIVANGLQGTYLHARGIAQKPGGWRNARYNMEMGPPLLAPLLVTMVGGMGLLAAILRREK